MGYNVAVGKFPFASTGKAQCLGEVLGFVKLVADAKTNTLLGGQIIGPSATDIITEIAIAVKYKLRPIELAETIHAHPTLSEAVMEAAHDVYQEAIHKLSRMF